MMRQLEELGLFSPEKGMLKEKRQVTVTAILKYPKGS